MPCWQNIAPGKTLLEGKELPQKNATETALVSISLSLSRPRRTPSSPLSDSGRREDCWSSFGHVDIYFLNIYQLFVVSWWLFSVTVGQRFGCRRRHWSAAEDLPATTPLPDNSQRSSRNLLELYCTSFHRPLEIFARMQENRSRSGFGHNCRSRPFGLVTWWRSATGRSLDLLPVRSLDLLRPSRDFSSVQSAPGSTSGESRSPPSATMVTWRRSNRNSWPRGDHFSSHDRCRRDVASCVGSPQPIEIEKSPPFRSRWLRSQGIIANAVVLSSPSFCPGGRKKSPERSRCTL
ncbi:hypothetical protein TIFTF001_032820 [Ficus carica]|uniref:Uncharacterized protein n=1 Tax=Ficus carica TaxID=3494 RepID=A0AA88DXX5_FICCA|nr:hypothetical protein TIFTF001_032820 [Ficus carica]